MDNDKRLYGGEIKLNYMSCFNKGVLYHGWNKGFFSCVSTCLWNLVSLYATFRILPEKIDFSGAFRDYKTERQLAEKTDIFPLLFKVMPGPAELRTNMLLSHHTRYNAADVQKLSVWVTKFFGLADPLRVLQKEICRKYEIDVKNTLAVCMRGTDKLNEIRNAMPEFYLRQCNEVLKKKPRLRIWVQTDQEQYRDYFLERFPGRAFAIDELPVSQGSVGIHLDGSMSFDRFKFGQYLLAVMHLMAGCDTIITHTGNVGYWQALFRGNTCNMYQDTTAFYRSLGCKCSGQFNRFPIIFKILDTLRRYKVLTLSNYELRRLLNKGRDRFREICGLTG